MRRGEKERQEIGLKRPKTRGKYYLMARSDGAVVCFRQARTGTNTGTRFGLQHPRGPC
jgi:hypothetical protein